MDKKWRYYLLIGLFLFSGMIFLDVGLSWLKKYYLVNLEAMYLPYQLFVFLWALGGILVGTLLGADGFLAERRRPGPWRINYAKLVCLGLPALLLANSQYILIIAGFNTVPEFLSLLTLVDDRTLVLAWSVFSYTVVTAFYKESDFRQNG